jgi:hypothetical protein
LLKRLGTRNLRIITVMPDFYCTEEERGYNGKVQF